MSRSKPIWNKVTSCRYKNSPSWGAVNDCRTDTYTGSSASNSYILATTEVRKKIYDDIGIVAFNFYVDEQLLKQNLHIYTNNMRAGDLLTRLTSNFLNGENRHKHRVNYILAEYIEERKR